MDKRTVSSVLLVVLAAALLAALTLLVVCRPQEVDLQFETIERADAAGTGEYYEDKEPKLVVMTDAEQADLLGNTISLDTQVQLRDVDFDQYFVIVVFQGWRPTLPTPRSGVEIRGISRKGSRITIYAQLYEPIEGYEQKDVVISPYHLIRVQKEQDMQGEFEFVLNADGTVVSRQTCRLP